MAIFFRKMALQLYPFFRMLRAVIGKRARAVT